MRTEEIYKRLADTFGEYEDSGIIHSNGRAPSAKRLLNNRKYKKINIVVGTYNYKIRKDEIYVDELGASETKESDAGILIPHSVIDISAMCILEREIRKMMAK